MADLERLLKEQEIEDQKVQFLEKILVHCVHSMPTFLFFFTVLCNWFGPMLTGHDLVSVNLNWAFNVACIIKIDIIMAFINVMIGSEFTSIGGGAT